MLEGRFGEGSRPSSSVSLGVIGNTADFGSVIPGSSPGGRAQFQGELAERPIALDC